MTRDGPACVACAPGSLPTCKGDRFVATCTADGALEPSTDCGGQEDHCVGGRCVARECEPNASHCYEGDVYRCDAGGTGRTLVTRCLKVDADGSIDASKGVCQVRRGRPACRADCGEPRGTILAMRDCEACAWDKVPYCAEESPERGCSDWICGEGGIGFGVVSIPCWRETDGAIVPDSDRRWPCEGEGAIGTRAVSYEVCKGGASVSATRTEPCLR